MKIKNNSTYLNSTGMQKASYDFYTNDDAEMKLRHENEWYQRIYFQGVDTFDKGGYVLFDTFTYDDEHLPRLKDYFEESTLTGIDADGNEKYFGNYGCFNREHFAKFMKDLRSDLADNGFDVKDNLKYVYVTEYGSDKPYTNDRGTTSIGTLRPHYHLMLFVTDMTLTPGLLNEYIGKHWFYGFHGNGKNFAELRRNTFHSGMNATDTKVRLRGLANYIGKYMHKQSEYEEKIMSRIYAIASKMCKDTYDFGEYAEKAARDLEITKLLENETDDDVIEALYEEQIVLHRWFLSYRRKMNKKGFKIHSLKDAEDDQRECWKVCYKHAYNKLATFHGQSQHFGEYALQEPNFDINEVAETGMMRMPDKKKVVKFLPIPLYYRRKLFYEQVRTDQGMLAWVLKSDEMSHKYYKNMTYRNSAMQADIYRDIYSKMSLQDRIKVDCWMYGRNMDDLAAYVTWFKDAYFDCDLTDIGVDEAIEIRLSQDFTRKDVNGNVSNTGQNRLLQVNQLSREDFAHFDDVLRVFQPYLDKRHEDFNEVFKKKEHLHKIHKK